jgi:hypothetical protein
MDAEALFVRTISDLEQRAATTDEYEALLGAGLLRKLLLDALPLVDQVNANYGLKLRFLMNGPTPYEELVLADGPTYWSLEDAIDPTIDQPPGLMAPQEATRDQLLSRRVMIVNGEKVSVRDLIDQLAHIEGAVHSAQPREPREAMLKQVARELYIGGLPAGVRQIQSIARVVAGGLAPLRKAVLEPGAETRAPETPDAGE